MVDILGISAYYHDSAAALLRDGDVVAAAQEERLSRVKFDSRYPARAIELCLRQAGIGAGDLDFVAFYEKPLRKFERILLTQLAAFPRSWEVFREAMTAWLKHKLWIKAELLQHLDVSADRVLFVDHHMSHAASAAFCAPFGSAAVLTVDGVGEWTTAAVGAASSDWDGSGVNDLQLRQEIQYPHSLGLLYSAFTGWLGFKVNSGEYKVMGMAPYGTPRYVDKVERLIALEEDGSFRLDLRYFAFHRSLDQTVSTAFLDLFGSPRRPETPFPVVQKADGGIGAAREEDQYYADVAASVQLVTEEVLLRMARHIASATGERRLVMAGGVALNSVAVGRIMREGPFDEVFVQPNAGDAGGALGAALYVWHVLLGHPRRFVMDHAYLGEECSEGEVAAVLGQRGVRSERIEEPCRLADRVVGSLLSGKVVGLHQGRFEWGPRALGNRSILADPRHPAMRDVVNEKVKFREPFRPFAPAVAEDAASRYFDLGRSGGQYPQRFMQMVAPARPDTAGLIPAVVHGGTARLQVVRPEWNPLFAEIVHRFGEATGIPVVLNTSLNLRGEPMAAGPLDSLNTFASSGVDALVLGCHFVEKE
jgi:carbamoyltransferase